MRTRTLVLVGLLLALVLAGGVSYYASADPDGLERVAEDKGFGDRATDHDLADSPVADYSVRGVADGRLSGGLAGVIGVVVTLALGGGLFAVVSRRRRPGGSPGSPAGSAPGGGSPGGGSPAGGSPAGGAPGGGAGRREASTRR